MELLLILIIVGVPLVMFVGGAIGFIISVFQLFFPKRHIYS